MAQNKAPQGGVTVKMKPLHMGQQEIYDNLTDRVVCRCGRRFGKSTLFENVMSRRAITGRKVGWFTPDYKLMRPSFHRMRDILAPITQSSSRVDALITLWGGGSVEFWTLDNEDAGRSRDYDDVFIDEASLKKKGLRDIVEQAIMPTLLDRRGTLSMAGTPKGIDPDNYFYIACTDKSLGFREFYAPTRNNPKLDPIGVANLENDFPALVYQQEYLATFVDWSGDAFFSLPTLLTPEGQYWELPTSCSSVFATIDTATKTGREHDGTGVLYLAYQRLPEPRLYLVDYDLVQIQGNLLETWLPSVYRRLDELATELRSSNGSSGVFIEDKSSGTILLQQALRRGWMARPIDSKLTSVGKDERCISISGYVHRRMVRLTKFAHEKQVRYHGQLANHLEKQVLGYRVGLEDQEDDLLDCFSYSVSLGLGNRLGY